MPTNTLSPTITTNPTNTPIPTATISNSPTETPIPTATVAPAATPTEPSAPSLTPTPTVTMTPMPTATTTVAVGPPPTATLAPTAIPTSAFRVESVAASVGSSSATISWTTTQPGSSVVYYGLLPYHLINSPERDTENRVLTHQLQLLSLVPCTTYVFEAASLDGNGNSAVGSVSTFTTEGCTGNAAIVEHNSNLASGQSEQHNPIGKCRCVGSLNDPRKRVGGTAPIFQINELVPQTVPQCHIAADRLPITDR